MRSSTRSGFFLIFLISSITSYGQKQGQAITDSLLLLLGSTQPDTCKVNLLNTLSWEYSTRNPDSALNFSNEALAISKNIKWPKGEGSSYHQIGWANYNIGKYAESITCYLKALECWEILIDDSLRTRGLNADQDFMIYIKKASTLGNLGLVYSDKADFTKALDYYFKALKLDAIAKNKNGISRHYGNIGFIFWSQGEYNKALEYYFKALKISLEIKNKYSTSWHLSKIGLAYWNQGQYPKALDYFFNALRINEEMDNKSGIARDLGNIGNVYVEIGNLQKGLEYDLKALTISERIKNKKGIALQYGNIGDIFQKQGDYNKAIEYYFKALQIDIDLGIKNGVARHLSNIGIVFDAQNEYAKALIYFHKALTIQEELNDNRGIANTYGKMGLLFSKNKNNIDAEIYLKKSIELSHKIGELYCEELYLEKLGELYEENDNYFKALKYYKVANRLRDSLFNVEKNKEITRKEMNYEFEKKEASSKAAQQRNDDLNKAELLKQKHVRNYLISFFCLLVLTGILLFSRFQLKKKLEKQEAIIEERRRISTDMHDDLGSNLSKISLISELLKKKSHNEKEKDNLENISSSAQNALEKMSEIVWALNPKNDKLTNLLAYIRKYAVEYFEPTSIECKIIFPSEIADIELSGEQRRNIFLSVKESLHNVVKHSGASKAEVKFSNEIGSIEISISDNGKGINANSVGKRMDGSYGNGIESMKQRMEKINGMLQIDNNKGTLIRLIISII